MISVESIKQKIARITELDTQLAKIEAESKTLNLEKSTLKVELTAMLKELNEKNFTCEFGTITRVMDLSVKSPQGTDKIEFFNFLKERGVFEGMASINYQTLNAYYKEQRDLAIAGGDALAALNFTLPGIKDAKTFETIRFRKKQGSKNDE